MSKILTAARRRIQFAIIGYEPEMKTCVQEFQKTTFFADINDHLIPYMRGTGQKKVGFHADAETILTLKLRLALPSDPDRRIPITGISYNFILIRHPLGDTNAFQKQYGIPLVSTMGRDSFLT